MQIHGGNQKHAKEGDQHRYMAWPNFILVSQTITLCNLTVFGDRFYTPPLLEAKLATETLTPSPAPMVYKTFVPKMRMIFMHHWRWGMKILEYTSQKNQCHQCIKVSLPYFAWCLQPCLGDWFSNAVVLGGDALCLWGCQIPARCWMNIVHPWVQTSNLLLGLGSGGIVQGHFQTPLVLDQVLSTNGCIEEGR